MFKLFLCFCSLLGIISGQKPLCQSITLTPKIDIKMVTAIPSPLPFIMYSGFTNNNPGQMLECQEKNFTYFLVSYENATSLLNTFTGLCVPPECTAQDVQKALQSIHPTIYDFQEDEDYDGLCIAGFVVCGLWFSILVVWSFIISCKEPAMSEFLQNEKERTSINLDDPKEEMIEHENQQQKFKLFNFYEGYSKLFQPPKTKNILSPILFLAVLSYSISTEFSYRQTISQNQNNSAAALLNSFWGLFICNTEIALSTIVFILGLKFAYGVSQVQTFKGLGRYFFDNLIKKWLFLVIISLFIYSFLCLTQQPLSTIWQLNYGQDCPGYMWQMWFFFRNLQLDCKACLPWLFLLPSEIMFTQLAAPVILIYRVNKKLSNVLFGLMTLVSILASYAILDNQNIIFMPTKLMNGQKQYALNYQTNSFVRMGAFFFGLFLGLFMVEGLGKGSDKAFEESLAKKVRSSSKLQYFLHFFGLALMIMSYSLVALYFNVNPNDGPNTDSYGYLILVPLVFLLGLALFILPSFWLGKSKLTILINRVLGWRKWVHLERISITFYVLAPMVIGFLTYSMQSSIYYDYFTIFTYMVGDLFLTYLLTILVAAGLQSQLEGMSDWLEMKVYGNKSKYSALMIEQ